MTHTQFVKLAAAVRHAQRVYFRERDPATLANARRLERELDAAIEADLAPPAEPSLFDRIGSGEADPPRDLGGVAKVRTLPIPRRISSRDEDVPDR